MCSNSLESVKADQGKEHMNTETDKLFESLMLMYGKDLVAATVTVLLKDGDSVRYITTTVPQQEK